MDQIILFVQENIQYAHFMIFGLLLLAGLNLPVSEDAMLFISAILAREHEPYLVKLFIGVFLGAYFSDLIAYTLGRKLGRRLWKINFFKRMVSEERVDQISHFYRKYGVFTLILGRFIPFGVRNALFLSAGFGKMPFLKFALSDLLACSVSCSFFFWLYYSFGNAVIEIVKKGNIALFSVFILGLLTVLYVKKKNAKSQNQS